MPSKDMKFYAGIDIEPMRSPLSRKSPTYSIAIYQGKDTLIFEKRNVKRHKLIQYLNKYKVSFLAMDNIFELVKDNKELYQYIKKFPVGIKIIQVTGNPAATETLKPLKIISQQNNIKVDFSDPLEAAKACIQLAYNEIGYEIRLFKDETKIVIAPSKVPGKGGQSINRYKRNLTSRILNISREVQSLLEKGNLDYDLSVRKSEFGLDWAHFLVYSNYKNVYKIVKPAFTPKIKIKVTPVKQKEVEYVPLKGKKDDLIRNRRLIVGLDPGTTIGLAIMDLKGRLLNLISQKQMSRNDIRKLIYNKYGLPAIIGTDVPKIPRFVEKFANSTNALIYHPHSTIKVAEKIELVNEYIKTHPGDINVDDAHQRDALVSAIKAYQFFKDRFNKVETKVREMNLNVDIDIGEVKEYIIKGHSVFDAISLASPSIDEEETKEIESTSIFTKIKKLEKNKKILENRIERLQNKNTMLLNEIQGLNLEIKNFREKASQIDELKNIIENLRDQEYKELRKERSIATLDKEISQLKKQVNRKQYKINRLSEELDKSNKESELLRELNLIDKFYNIIVLQNFSMDAIQNAKIENDIIFIKNISGAGPNTALELVDKRIRCVIYDTKICATIPHEAEEVFRRNNIIIIPAEQFKMIKINEYEDHVLINKKSFEEIYKKWVEKHEEKLLLEKEKQLKTILSRYRNERKKKIN
ncbi:MAG: DUF460 domain-containing protein [Candidatus Lokiarchaeota archaeon]|nr:DUF460 domain-containing protein [Candidatus Lokiarchaeota archaeon]